MSCNVTTDYVIKALTLNSTDQHQVPQDVLVSLSNGSNVNKEMITGIICHLGKMYLLTPLSSLITMLYLFFFFNTYKW